MTTSRILFSIFLSFLFYGSSAQQAEDFLRSAMNQYGPWEEVKGFHYISRQTNVNRWQAYSFTNPKPTRNRVEMYYDEANGRYHTNTTFHSAGGYVFDFVFIGKDSTRIIYDKVGARNGKMYLKGGKDVFLSNITQVKQNLPYYLLQLALASGDTLAYANKGATVEIERLLKDGTRQHYEFNAASKELKRITRVAAGKKNERLFNNYRKEQGLLLAGSIVLQLDGAFVASDSIIQFRVNTSIPQTLFEVPSGYTLFEAPAPSPLTAKEIAKDIFLISGVSGDRNVVFISMDEYIVVTEAPISPDVTKSVLALIRKTIPGKPVRYVHLSHFHSDHAAGIRQMVAEGITVMVTPQLEAPIRAILKGELAPFKDDYAQAPREPRFSFFTGRSVLKDANHHIDFHEVANTHADGLSFLHLPKEGLIYEGDLLTVPEDGTLTPAIEVTRAFAAYLKKNSIRWKRIIGHHSHADINPDMLQQMLKMKKAK